MDLIAENRVITPSVKQTAPPISIAASVADLFELPSYNIYSPSARSVAEITISKNVDILLMENPSISGMQLDEADKTQNYLRIPQYSCVEAFGGPPSRMRSRASALESSRKTGIESTLFMSEPQVTSRFRDVSGWSPISRRRVAD
jgi:hypothetical protein